MNVDLTKIRTEQRNEATKTIDELSVEEIVSLINFEDYRAFEAVQECKMQITHLVEKLVNCFESDGRLIYVGAGTSGRIGIIDAVELRPTYGISPDMVRCLMAGGINAFVSAVEGAEDNKDLGKQDLKDINLNSKDFVIGIAASGRTPYVLGAIEYAKSIECSTGCIVTTPNSILESLVDYPICAVTGEEVVTGSTRMKSGTAQKMICNIISTTAMIKLGKVYQNLMIDVLATNEKLVARTYNILQSALNITKEEAVKLIEKYQTVKKALFSELSGITDIKLIDYYLDKTKGHIKKALEVYKNDQTR